MLATKQSNGEVTTHYQDLKDRLHQRVIELLDLNDPRKVEFRSLWIVVVSLSERLAPELHLRVVGYPTDLPDLSRLRPPSGNSRPEGIAESHHASRARGELPATY